ncbi:MAG: 2-hydroxyacyl-CoA dehydratase family protein [Fusobacteriaceae bacterium]|jgi:bcr-type benzoyl-CoA reductase subunit C|nr:2-hydroxyacyl-CoA dehydratase family protein [Fusobacteriaceae bacterium]
MERISALLQTFRDIAANPGKQLYKYKGEGKKAIGVFPYYAPEELVYAADMVPFGVWGRLGTINKAKEYFASFYCTIAQMNLEMGLTGALDGLSGVIVTTMCDTLRPLSQNFRLAVPQIPFLFLAHPQNRRPEYGIKFTMAQYGKIKKQLEEIAGSPITDEKLQNAIKVYNKSRAARRKFVKLAGQHPDVISAVDRGIVLKSGYYLLKCQYTKLLDELNGELEKLPVPQWKGIKVLTSGIIVDNDALLKIFDENKIAIVADDVAHESRSFDVDAPEDETDPMRALALHFAAQDNDPLLYDPEIVKRPAHVVKKAKDAGANGAVVFAMTFCDPEELEYPSLKKAFEEAGIPHIILGYDQQMADFGQARTSLQAFAESL